MRSAIALSALGLGSTSPNPPVGCVILDSAGDVAGVGYHERKGEAHAEGRALEAASGRARGGTAVVTLEPCNHSGRTPPCHQTLIDAGVARVVIAVLDPTSRGKGGAARLRDAGIDVEVGVLRDEAMLVLGPWLTALGRRWPVVTWLYTASGEGLYPPPDGVLSSVRSAHDTVLDANGVLSEGLAGSHGVGVFSLPYLVESPVRKALESLYETGTRTLVLAGGHDIADPFLDAGLVDEVQALIPTSTLPGDAALLPTGFRIQRIWKNSHGVVIDGVRLHEPSSDGELDGTARNRP